ncbi:hypothetical protein Tco_1459697, partial [Tanacetum coccineum]
MPITTVTSITRRRSCFIDCTVVTVGAPRVVQDAPIIDEGGQAVPAPVQAPQQPPPPPPALAWTMPQRISRLEEDVHEIRGALTEQRE